MSGLFQIASQEIRHVQNEEDLILVRTFVKSKSVELGLSLVNQTKCITAASELARNTLIYGKGGVVKLEIVESGGRQGLRMIFEDKGPGIKDIDQAMTDGYTSGNGMGLGLSGSKRIMDEFILRTEPGAGTSVTVVKWK